MLGRYTAQVLAELAVHVAEAGGDGLPLWHREGKAHRLVVVVVGVLAQDHDTNAVQRNTVARPARRQTPAVHDDDDDDDDDDDAAAAAADDDDDDDESSQDLRITNVYIVIIIILRS